MKTILLLTAVLISTQAKAWDAVGVFHRPEKVLVQINERGGETSRLSSMMTALGFNERMLILNADKSVKFDCSRNHEAATCVFRFLPSENVVIETKKVLVAIPLKDLNVVQLSDLEIKFLNSNGDHLEMVVKDGRLEITAAKR